MVTAANIKQFKKLYVDAVKAGDEQFTFEGLPVLVVYAKYVIEYFEQRGV